MKKPRPVLNTSPENQRLLAIRRNKLLLNQTAPEIHVSRLLTELKEKFLPQKGFYTGVRHFIVDFYLPKRRQLCLEIDGKYHENQKQYDEARDRFLTVERGFRVIRITNEHALSLDAAALRTIIF